MTGRAYALNTTVPTQPLKVSTYENNRRQSHTQV